ncbi:MAG: glycosyltransferase family 4 protein [Anaerolineales bacterium]|nr:glycosyltransferase family 4 protein [Anaerolineales bacterium]
MRLGLDLRLTYYTGGGIAKYAARLAAELPRLAPADTHIHLYRRGHTARFSPQARRVACWTPAHHRLETLALSVEAWPHRLDLLHSPDFIPPLFGARRHLITVHDLAFLRYPQFLTAESRRYYNGQIASAVRRAQAIAADSHATKADLVELLGVPAEKITVIHLGLDPHFRPRPAEAVAAVLARHHLAAGFVLFVGTFEPRKNVPGLLRAYAVLRAAAPDAPPLVLAGLKGWLFDETMQLAAELGLANHLRFFENFPSADLPELYSAAGVLVLPSHYEGFGFPVLEAMGCEVPVVISDRSSLPEIAGDAALKVDPDSPEALAEALRQALGDSGLRAALIGRGRANSVRFTWEKTARETLALYQRVLAG